MTLASLKRRIILHLNILHNLIDTIKPFLIASCGLARGYSEGLDKVIGGR
jgi:hypothetical protein